MSIALLLQRTTVQPATPSQEQLREQIRQSVREATQAAKEAAAEAKANRQDRNIIIGPVPPGMSGSSVPFIPPDIPRRIEEISIAFFAMIAVIVVGLPIMRAIARRIDK